MEKKIKALALGGFKIALDLGHLSRLPWNRHLLTVWMPLSTVDSKLSLLFFVCFQISTPQSGELFHVNQISDANTATKMLPHSLAGDADSSLPIFAGMDATPSEVIKMAV